MEGAVVLKVGQSEHLTSFPDTLLSLFHKSLLIGVHLKKKKVEGGKAFDGQEGKRKGRSGEPERAGCEKSFWEHDSWLQSVIVMGFN